MTKTELIQKLAEQRNLTDEEFRILLEDPSSDEELYREADRIRRSIYGDEVYIRGLIELTNYCKNNCYYCGIRRDNRQVQRYRLTKEQILACCEEGWKLGYRTFVLQGGEDPWFSDDRICELVSAIRQHFPDCAITLSLGEKSKESYQAYYDAGADRYLLRHETAREDHYRKLHPASMSLAERKQCLFDLKEIGYEVGSGFMVGAPYQNTDNLIADLRFLQELKPDMVGIGPYITHAQTPFAGMESGSFRLSVRLLAILRLLFPDVLLPATTALGTIHPKGREIGLQAGANVIMPNLSPTDIRALYSLYNNKIGTGEEAAQTLKGVKDNVNQAGYRIVTSRGDRKETDYD